MSYAAGAVALDTLVNQMWAMKQSVLEEYAQKFCGLAPAVLDLAIDAADPKAAIIKLIIEQQPPLVKQEHGALGATGGVAGGQASHRTPPDQQASSGTKKSHQKASAAAAAAQPQSTDELADEEGICPFCDYTWGGSSSGPGDDVACDDSTTGKKAQGKYVDVKTRKRRVVGPRRQNRKGRWWRRVGYDGPAYCQRCSECFRDHIIRAMSNSAGCTRQAPCNECSQILTYFPRGEGEMDRCWQKMDQKKKPAHRLRKPLLQVPAYSQPTITHNTAAQIQQLQLQLQQQVPPHMHMQMHQQQQLLLQHPLRAKGSAAVAAQRSQGLAVRSADMYGHGPGELVGLAGAFGALVASEVSEASHLQQLQLTMMQQQQHQQNQMMMIQQQQQPQQQRRHALGSLNGSAGPPDAKRARLEEEEPPLQDDAAAASAAAASAAAAADAMSMLLQVASA